MIISQSTIGLDSFNQNHTSLSIKTSQQSSSQATQTTAGNHRWEVNQNISYQYDNRVRSKLVSNSQVSQVGQPQIIQHSMIEASQKLTSIQLNASQAQIAIQHAFPAEKNKNQSTITASGFAEFEFKQHIQYQQDSHNIMSAQGSVKLNDGREVNFNLHLEHQQSTRMEAMSSLSLQKVVMHDPLVINLGDQPVSLQDTHFQFDLLGDGNKQQYAKLGGGAGYLTFDANGDGKVTDGSELFGTKTGDAYAELAQYDDDGNGWIDENDAIFHQLKIWVDQADNQATISLAEAGVGAIYLGNVPFEYTMRSSEGGLQGQSKQAGLVLMENGEAKTSQAIDLAPILEAKSVTNIQDSPEFLALKKMSSALNAWQQAQNAWRTQFTPQNSSPFNQTESPKSWFAELQEQIQKMVEERRNFLEKMFGKPDKPKLAQA